MYSLKEGNETVNHFYWTANGSVTFQMSQITNCYWTCVKEIRVSKYKRVLVLKQLHISIT